MPYTNVAKPTGTSYTKVNDQLLLFDSSSVLYDDPLIFYDGFTVASYTNLAKPTSSVYTKVTKPT